MTTTLLGQADAAVGGKTALDWGEIKNVIGTFALPPATLNDPRFLLTLPQVEVFSGLAEVVKHALIASREKLLQERIPLYARSSDLLVANLEGRLEQTARLIHEEISPSL